MILNGLTLVTLGTITSLLVGAAPGGQAQVGSGKTMAGGISTAPLTTTPAEQLHVYFTGILVGDPAGPNQFVDLTMGGASNGPDVVDPESQTFSFTYGLRFRVDHAITSTPPDYSVLLTPAEAASESDIPVSRGRFSTEMIDDRMGLHLSDGWGIFIGRFPVGRTDWVYTSAEGSTMAMLLQKNSKTGKREVRIYNLAVSGASKVNIYSTGTGKPKLATLAAWEYGVVSETSPTAVTKGSIPASEHSRICRIYQWADAANMGIAKKPGICP
jgi:hypothetical protein